MFDAFIIEQIRKREEDRRQPRHQPALESPNSMPLERPPHWDRDLNWDRDVNGHRDGNDDGDGRVVFDM